MVIGKIFINKSEQVYGNKIVTYFNTKINHFE